MPAFRQSRGTDRSEPNYPTSAVNRVLGEVGLPRITYEDINQLFDASGIPRDGKRPALIENFLANADQTGLVVIGLKPEATPQIATDIFIVTIPEDRLCIHLFSGGTRPEAGMFFFDFYDARQHAAVNAPPGYAVAIVWPGGLAGPITSIEATLGVPPDEGMEKFTVVEKVRCALTRPGRAPYLFDIPSRSPPAAGVGQAVRVQ